MRAEQHPTQSESRSGVGYDVTITHRRFEMTGDDWHVHVRRLSDGAEIIRIFAWRWRAKRFGRSTTRLARAFRRAMKLGENEVEHFVLRYPE